MALPLVALAATFLPELVRLIAGDRAGTAAAQVAGAVQTITGTSDPAAAQQLLAAEPAKAAELRIRLAEIALEQAKLQQQAEDNARKAELDERKLRNDDTAGARGTMVSLQEKGGWIASAPAVLSGLIILGFFVVVGMLLSGRYDSKSELLNIVIGTLVAAFTAVVNFWLGSSQGSRDKDATVRQLQQTQANQTSEALRGLQSLAQAAPATPKPVPPAPVDGFARCLDQVLQQEGGFSQHPADPGGATNLGITLRTLEEFRGRPVTVEDVRALGRDEAREIYRANYWIPMRCADLPPGLDLMVFDFGVNAGPRTAVKLLQQAMGVKDDGSIGPVTLAALRAIPPEELVARLAERRLAHYQSLDTFPIFGAGWTNRVSAVKQAALRMALEAAPQPA